MHKYLICIAVLAVAGFMASGCESEGQNSLKLACEAKYDKAFCKNITSELQLECYQNIDNDKRSNCDSVVDAFSLSCVISGGKYNDSRCICSNTPCSKGVICEGNGQCDGIEFECNGAETKCTDDENSIGQLRSCSNGQLGDATACPNNVSCTKDGTKCGNCKNGDIKNSCKTNEEGIGEYSICQDGDWSTVECDGSSCKGDTCGDCKNGAMRCEGVSTNKYTLCNNGEWNQEIYTCPGEALCETGKCLDEDLEICPTVNSQEVDKCINDNGSNDGFKQRCVNGKLTSERSICLDPDDENKKLSCNANKTDCGKCHIGDTICRNSADGVGNAYRCNADAVLDKIRNDKEFSCKGNEIGDCRNGKYTYISEDSDRGVKICSAGQYEIGTNFSRVIKWDGSKVLDFITDNYDYKTFNVRTDLTGMMKIDIDDNDTCNFNNTESVLNINNKKIGGGTCDNYIRNPMGGCDANLFYFLKYLHGVSKSDDVRPAWLISGNAADGFSYRWFNCKTGAGGCESITFCIDAVVDSNYSEIADAYVVTISNAADGASKPQIHFVPAPKGCNSNHTAERQDSYNQNNCNKKVIDSRCNFNSNDETIKCSTCNQNSYPKIECKNIIETCEISQCRFNDTFSCTFNGALCPRKNICIDFYDEEYNRISYAFKKVEDGGGMKFCESGCNKNWTGCSDEPEE